MGTSIGETFYVAPGKGSTEFKALLMGFAATIGSPLLKKYLNVDIDPLVLSSFLASVVAYIGARTWLKRTKKEQPLL